jgi:bile acid-coenzyme A ligase
VTAIDERLRERAVTNPFGRALVTHVRGREHVWTWAELERATAGMAGRLAGAARAGPSVLLATAGSDPQRLVRFIAALRTTVPIAVVSATAPAPEQQALREEMRRAGHRLIDGDDLRPSDECSRATAVPFPAESLLLGTGGSTGRPKLVVDTWMRTVARRPRPVRPSTAMRWRPGQRQLVMGPLHHAASLTFFVEGLADGNQLVLPPAAAPAATLEVIDNWRVEWLQFTPYHMRQLAASAGCGRQLATVRGVLHLGAPCPRSLKQRWLELIGADRVFEMYGATEGLGVTIARGDEWLRRPGTVGRGFFTHIRILDEHGRMLPAGGTGQIYLRTGTPVRRVYLHRDDVLATTIDNFASVGDQGHLDSDGYLYLSSRQATRIQVGGETVDPSEVEYALMQHPGVLDAAVIGVPDDRLGESLIALVIPAGTEDTKNIRQYLRRRLAPYKVPRTIRYVSRLPRTAAGKLDRARLAAPDLDTAISNGDH